jgi:hypothetical protein
MLLSKSRLGQRMEVGGLAVGSHADDHRGRAVPEDHARGADIADLVGELLGTDHEHRPLDLLEQPRGLGQAVGHAGAGSDDVVGGVGLVDPELAGDKRREGRDQPRAGAGADQDTTDLLRLALRLRQRGLRGLQGQLLQAQRAVPALLDPGLVADLIGPHR